MKQIKILVSCHKKSYLPENALLSSIQVGAALSEKKFEADYYDDARKENISEKNKMYCELTAQYWAYKNITADYYGFFHYRRYLAFKDIYPVDCQGNLLKKARHPYEEIPSIKDNLEQFGLDENRMRTVIEQYDIITVLRERMNVSVYRQYCQFHKKQDIDLLIDIVKELHPEYTAAMQWYLDSKKLYFMNMYIMKKQYFDEYAEFAFSVLEEFEKRMCVEEYSEAELRVIGFLAERLFGIYYTKKRREAVKCCELMYLIFDDTEPVEQVLPYYREAEVPIVMAANNRFSPYLSVAIESLKERADKNRNYDLVILHTDIEKQNQKTIERMGTSNFHIRFYNVKDYVRQIPFEVHHHLSKETFYRYFIPEIFSEQEKILYLDADIVVLSDVSELYDTNIEDNYLLAAVKDIEAIGNCRMNDKYIPYLINDVGLNRPMDYFQAGVLLINLKTFRNQIKTEQLIQKTLQQKWNMLDQDVLNWACQGKVKFLEMRWNVLMDWKYSGKSRMDIIKNAPNSVYQMYLIARNEPAVIHYAGAWKPWRMPRCDYAEEFWYYARKSPFYETILYENIYRKHGDVSSQESTKRVFVLKPTKVEIAVDMKRINRLFPAGSRRRIWLRNLILH